MLMRRFHGGTGTKRQLHPASRRTKTLTDTLLLQHPLLLLYLSFVFHLVLLYRVVALGWACLCEKNIRKTPTQQQQFTLIITMSIPNRKLERTGTRMCVNHIFAGFPAMWCAGNGSLKHGSTDFSPQHKLLNFTEPP